MGIIKDISKYYLIEEPTIQQAIEFPQRNYRRIKIVQSNGESRFVFAPSKIIKMCQTYLLKHCLNELEYSQHAFAYTKKRSIVSCALTHVGNTHFLHIDIRHFFDNIDWNTFRKSVIDEYPSSKIGSFLINEPDTIKNILCLNGRFCQGSVTSPYVSNYYLKSFDSVLNNYVIHNLKNGVYSRYSDDVYISSSEKIDSSIISFIINHLREQKLKINYKKVRFFSMGDSVKILGVTITNRCHITINVKFKKMVKNSIYKALNSPNQSNSRIKNRLIGLMYYSYMVDPLFFNYLQQKYSSQGKLTLTRIMEIG